MYLYITLSTHHSWAGVFRDRLEEQNSCLEFKLHRLQFIDLISQDHQNQHEVLMFAKQFERFANKHTRGRCLFNNLI